MPGSQATLEAYALGDHLEAAVFSVLVEILKAMDKDKPYQDSSSKQSA